MATKKISEFTTLGSLSDNDILPVVSGGANKKVTASVLKTYAQTGIDTGNITFSSDQISSTGEGVDVTSTGYSQLSSNSNYIWVDNTGIHVEVNTGEGGNEFIFEHGDGTSKLRLPAGGDIVDSSGNSVLGGSGGNPFDQSLNTNDIVTFNLLTVTDSAGIKNFNGDRITNTYVDGTMYVNGSNTQTPVSILIAGAGPRNEWAFTPDGKLTLPEIGTGIGWTNTDSAPTPDTGFLYSSTISFDKTQGIVLTNNVAGTDITWVIGKDGKIKLPAGGDIVDSNGNSVLGAGASTGDITFDGVQIIGAETTRGGGSIELVPNNSTEYVTAGQYINIYPTNAQDAPHIHVAAGAGGDLILGDDNYNVDVNHNGYVRVTAHDSADSITYQWRFNNDGQFQLPYNGSVQQNGSYTRTTNSWFTNSTDNSGIVWTALYNDVGSVKLTIQAQSLEVGGDEGLHYQVCEAIVASRGRSIEVGYGEPVMTVYGVTHTSTAPLATFSVQRNPVSKLIEIVATRTSATTTGIDFRIHSVEMIAID